MKEVLDNDSCLSLLEHIVKQAANDRSGIPIRSTNRIGIDSQEEYYHRDGELFFEDWRFDLICNLMGADPKKVKELIKKRIEDAGIH